MLQVLHDTEGLIEDKDRISLVKYGAGSDCRRIFSLVEKENNFVQLQNQVVTLCTKETPEASPLSMALKKVSGDFSQSSQSKHSQVKRWVVCFTSSLAGDPSLQQACQNLDTHRVNLLLFVYSRSLQEKAYAEQLVQHIRHKHDVEALVWMDPSPQEVSEAFKSIANYRLDTDLPLIMETFT